MTPTPTDPPPLLADALPRDPKALHALVMREHADRGGQLGREWWAILRDGYQGTGGFMRSVTAACTGDGGPGNREGGRAVGRSTYLTPFRREDDASFTARANRSAYENHVAPVVDIYHGHLIRRRAERATTIATLTAWWKNVDGHGHDVGEWVAGVALRAQLFGWCAALVDLPRGGGVVTATALDPGELRNWQVGHDGRLDWAWIVSEWKRTDPASGACVSVVEASLWTRDEWARVRLESAESEQWVEVLRDGDAHGLGRVPIAVLRWQEQLDGGRLYGLSQVQGVLPLVLALFNLGSELDDHLAGCAFSLLAVQTDDPASLNNLKLGTNNGFPYATNAQPPSFVSPGADVSMQYAMRIEQRLAAIYTAAKMEKPGASPAGGDPASGIAKAYDFTQTDAGLQTFAHQLTRFEFDVAALFVACSSVGDAAQVAAQVAAVPDATTIKYPTRFDAAGIAGDLGAQFAVLDDKVRAQLPPEMWRQARLALARGLNPEASPDTEALFVEQIDAMAARETDVAASVKPKVTELFAYDLEAGLIKLNDYLAAKGLPPRADGDVTIIEWRVAHGLNPDGSMPKPDEMPVDPAAKAAADVDGAIASLPAATPGALTTAPVP